jgi:hypothetical protein
VRANAFLVAALAAAVVAGPAGAGGKLKIRGKGVEGGNAFRFVFTDESGGAGQIEVETTSFGTITGAIDCLDTDSGLALMSGTIDVPTGGLTHFLLVVEDGKATRTPDQLITWLRAGSFDCALDGDDADLADSRQPIDRGKIVVKVPQS